MPVAEIVVLVVGLVSGSLANWLIYTVAYNPRPISPWAPPSPKAPPRRWFDRIPVVGWLGLRREETLHGRGFWVRPLLIEAGLTVGLWCLYRYELSGSLFPLFCRFPGFLNANSHWLHAQFAAHAILIVLLTAATFIDFDEQTIPDAITLPGTLLGLIAASLSPNIFLPSLAMGNLAGAGNRPVETTLLHVPGVWPKEFEGSTGLAIGLAIVAGWCFALLDRRVILRQGFRQAVRFFWARMFRHWFWKVIALAGVLVSLLTVAVWQVGGTHWQGLLTALIGLAVGGCVVWSVRLVAGWAMGVEAMGFGDVILLGMIGVFLGWQAALLTFMLAPFTAVVIVLVYWLVTGENRIAFGPYLCAGALIVMLFWERLWNPPSGFGHLFSIPEMIFGVYVVALALMGIMLRLLRWARGG